MALAVESRRRETLSAWWERHCPPILGGAALIVAYVYAPQFFSIATSKAWNATAIYFAVFDLASIVTAFLFTFYAFVTTTERGFIAQMKRTNAYRLFRRFTLYALSLTAILTLASVPYMVVGPTPVVRTDAALPFVSLWVGLTVWAGVAFVRAARIFVVFLTHQD